VFRRILSVYPLSDVCFFDLRSHLVTSNFSLTLSNNELRLVCDVNSIWMIWFIAVFGHVGSISYVFMTKFTQFGSKRIYM